MKEVNSRGYNSSALLMNKSIREMRTHVEYEKFLARMLIDNDDTRQFKINTEEHTDSLHKFIYNNSEIDKFTIRGKNEAVGKSAYVSTSGVI